MDAEIVTAVMTTGTFALAFFTFGYVYVGQDPVIELLKRQIRFTSPPKYEIRFCIRNRKKHVVYITNPTLIFPLGRPVKLERSKISMEVEHTYTIDGNQFAVDGIFSLAAGEVLDLELWIAVRMDEMEQALFPKVKVGHHPVIRATIREYTPRHRRYEISAEEIN